MVTLTCCLIAYQRNRRGEKIGDISFGMGLGWIPDGIMLVTICSAVNVIP